MSCPKSSHNSFYLNSEIFQKQPQMLPDIWATFYKKICHQEISNIAQSGHTDPDWVGHMQISLWHLTMWTTIKLRLSHVTISETCHVEKYREMQFSEKKLLTIFGIIKWYQLFGNLETGERTGHLSFKKLVTKCRANIASQFMKVSIKATSCICKMLSVLTSVTRKNRQMSIKVAQK